MVKANGTIVYPLTSQVNEANANEAYASMTTEFSSGTAFKDVSVNPKLKATFVEAEQNGISSATSDVVASAIFTEIRRGPHGSSISNDTADKIGNRILPTNTTLTVYATNKEITPSFKIKAYDSSIDGGDINRKFVYSTIDNPADDDTLGIDIENYDYFILINPEIFNSTTQSDSSRPHFAKITRITTFDEFGDGIEFSPKYPTPIPKNTNFEIFKGSAVTDTNVMAVSYGLRGDNNATTDNYDVLNLVATPTFYFYNDRLEQDNQLDYMEKYTLTRLRWYSYADAVTNTVTMTSNTEIPLYSEGSSTVKFTTNSSDETNKLCEGMSLFDSGTNEWYGNIKEITSNDIHLELAYKAKTATSTNFNVKIGKGIQNVVFRTEAKLKGTISNIGKLKLDATLVDNLRNTDDADGSFDPMFWHKAFPNMKRHEQDSTTPTVSIEHFDGEMNGPSRYITSDPRPRRNDIVPLTTDITVNSPQNKMTKMANVIALNNSGMMPKKIQTEQTLKVMNTVFTDRLTFKTLPFKASKVSGANEIRFLDMYDSHDYLLSTKLITDAIIYVDGYFYVVNTIQSKSSGTQDITVKARKTTTAKTFSVTSTVHEFTNSEVKISAYTGLLNTENFDSDTQVHYADGNRLTISGATIPKKDSKFYNSKIVFNTVPTHQNDVEYIDKDMEYVKFQNPNKKFYQNTSISRFYYYRDRYSLQEEVFDGTVEQSKPTAEDGLSIIRIEGRDNSALLLNSIVNENLLFSEDMVYSTLNPIIPMSSTESLTSVSVSGRVITHSSSDSYIPTAKTLLFTRTTGLFIGEVESATATAITLTHKPLAHMSTTTNIWYYNPFTEVTYVSGLKALGSNPAISSTTDFNGISDKGVIFQDSFSLDSSLSKTKLEGTSNTGSYHKNKTLGYDIRKPSSINTLSSDVSTDDSVFAYQLSTELGTSVTPVNLMSFSSERFNVVDVIEKDNGGARLRIAPSCPVVMGRIENNTSDTRSAYSFYLINSQINDGGFLHRYDTSHTTSVNLDLLGVDLLYTPRETYRYWDLQKFDYGTIVKNKAGIYSRSVSPPKVGGYAITYPIKSNGDTPASPTLTQESTPHFGSNMIDADYTLINATGSPFQSLTGNTTIVPPTKMPRNTVATDKILQVLNFTNYDPRAQNYELFALGDLYPYSNLRYNNLGNQTLNYDDLSCILESEGGVSTNEILHSSYTGVTKSVDKSDTNFERASIKSANKTTNEIKRFGIARLVEATFDWHFNPVDSDNLDSGDTYREELGIYSTIRSRIDKDNLKFQVDGSGNLTLTWTNGGTINLPVGSTIIRSSDGALVATVNVANASYSSGGTFPTHHKYNANNNTSATGCYVIPEYNTSNKRQPFFWEQDFNTPISTDSGTDKPDLTSVYIARPNYITDITDADGNGSIDLAEQFKYMLLKDSNNDPFDPPSIFLPIGFSAKRNDSSDNFIKHYKDTPFIPDDEWATGGTPPYFNRSRVIAGLLQPYKEQTALSALDKFGLEDDVHAYENCIAIFRDIKQLTNTGPEVPSDLFQTSSLLGSRNHRTEYEAYYHADSTFDSPTTNSIVWKDSTSSAKSIIGTHTNTAKVNQGTGTVGGASVDANGFTYGDTTYFMDKAIDNELTTTRVNTHNSGTTRDGGGIYSAKMMLKPFINMSDSNISHSGTTITIDLDDNDSQHAWLSFVPNLTGYYLVSERGYNTLSDTSLGNNDITGGMFNTLNRSDSEINIKWMAKIINHTHTQTTTSDGSINHVIELDKALPNSLKPVFRLMKLAETTFRDTPNEITINRLFDTGLDYTERPHNYRTGNQNKHISGQVGVNESDYNCEGVYSAYVIVNLDNSPYGSTQNAFSRDYVEAYHNLPYTTGDTFECYVTDGKNTNIKTMTVSYNDANANQGIRRGELKLSFDGVLNGNGLVSFGEIVSLELRRTPSLKNITTCHVGTSMIIGEEIETHIDKIVRDAGLSTNLIQTQSEFTGNIVSSVNNNVITCKATVENIVDGDVIYTHEGYPIGVVGSVSGTQITITDVHTDGDIDLWFVPLLNDELIKRNRKTFIATNNFTQTPTYQTLNKLAAKKQLDFKVKDRKVVFRDLNHTALLRKQTISFQTNRLFSISQNTSLFGAKVNKVTVIGDRIKTSMSTNDEGTHITFIDATIRNISDARIKAAELLEVHSRPARQITLKLEKKGLEILESGDIVFLDFEAQGIPAGDYVIFEIKNVLSSQITMTVGTYDKSIAERLTELDKAQKSTGSTLLDRNSEEESMGKLLQDSILLKTTLVQYTITGTGETANMGFDDVFGFGETVGFETTTNQVIGYYTSED